MKKAQTEILTLAEKINNANKTISTQSELVKLVGRMDSPFSLCVSAAKMIINGNGKLSFV